MTVEEKSIQRVAKLFLISDNIRAAFFHKASAFLALASLLLVAIGGLNAAELKPEKQQQQQQQQASEKLQRSQTLYAAKKFREALDVLNSFQDPGEGESKRLYYSALCLLHLGSEAEAVSTFQAIQKKFPKSEAAIHSSTYLLTKGTEPLGEASDVSKQDRKNSAKASDKSSKQSTTVPFRRTRKGQITVNATLNGRNMEMIFDTGAEECLFGQSQAEQAGVLEKTQSVTLRTVSGPVSAYYSPANIKLGEINRSVRVCVQDQNMEHGILGAPFMQGYTCTIDNRAGFLKFVPESAAESKRIDSVTIPFEEDGAKIIVSAKINDWATSMCFDTGAFGVCLSKKQAERFRIKIPEAGPVYTKGPNNLEVAGWDVTADISLGPFSKRNCPVRIMDCELSYPLLGQNFIGDKLFTIDRRSKEIQFAR